MKQRNEKSSRKRARNSESSEELHALRDILRQGIVASMQGNYQRRAPQPAAQARLEETDRKLTTYVRRHPDDAEAWLLLSQAQEAMLHYSHAIVSLKRAMLSGRRGKKELKTLARLQEACNFWKKLHLTPQQARKLAGFLNNRVTPDSRDFRLTMEWLASVGHKQVEKVLEASRQLGCNSDFEFFMNILL